MFLDKLLHRKDHAPETRFGYAVVGLGKIADAFLKAIADSPSVRATAMVSGNADKAAAIAKKYGAPHTYTYADFDRIADNPDVQAVYLALPVTMHREYTERAARAGKHVLCEKPMAPGAADCQAMIDACRTAGVRLSIAYRCPYDSIHVRAREIVRSGVLGEITRIESKFGFQLGPGWRMNAAEGGSLYDLGIYPLNAIRYLLDENPIRTSDAQATCDAHGLEQVITWTSHFLSGVEARCRSSYLEKLPDTLHLTGSNGTLTLDPAFNPHDRFHLKAHYTDPASGKVVSVDEQTSREAISQFRAEGEELAKAAANNRDPITPGEDGLRDLEAMEQIYRAAGVRLPGEV